jgi:hypothetical protein
MTCPINVAIYVFAGFMLLAPAVGFFATFDVEHNDNRHRNMDGEISHKHGNTLIRTLRKLYGQSFAAGHPETEKLSEVLLKLNESSLSPLCCDHETGRLEYKTATASK